MLKMSLSLITHHRKLPSPNQVIKRGTFTRIPAETVFVTKTLEDPVICVTDKENVDIIGPPDPVSNLRPIIRRVLFNETKLQRQLRKLQDETQSWNQQFWSVHNTKFIKERQDYINKHLTCTETKSTLTADEMSEFYKTFLDRNWKIHVWYNYEWYKRNFALLFLALRVNVENWTRNSL